MTEPTVTDLIPDEHNTNRHTERGMGQTRKSIEKFGPRQPIEVDKNGRIINGNGRQEIYADADLTDLEIIDAQPGKVYAVRYPDFDLSDPSNPAREYQVAQARTAQLSLDFDPAMMDFHQEQGVDFGDWFLDWELEALGAGDDNGQGESRDAEPQTSRADELQKIWQVETGQLWRLPSRTPGHEHRLICGDCTDGAVVARVMGGEKIDEIVTDPPYGVDYDGGTKKREKLAGDDSPALYYPALAAWREWCNPHIALYLWYADGDQVVARAVGQAVAQAGFQVRRTLIWNKNQAQYGALSQQYKQKHEPFLYCHLKGQSPYWAGDATEITVWEIARDSVNEFHPTQKPVPLYERAIRNSSKRGNIVFDGFAGSGTTAVACENLSRQARLIEISPAYCAVILDRYERAFGIKPELITPPG